MQYSNIYTSLYNGVFQMGEFVFLEYTIIASYVVCDQLYYNV